MKKKTVLLSLALTVALVFGAIQTVFAGVEGFQTIEKVTDEVTAENYCMKFVDEVQNGKYQLISAAGVKAYLGDSVVIIDTMPASSWEAHRVPGAINFTVPMTDEEFTNKADFIKAVDKAAGTVYKTQYYNSKSKKWQSKKPAAKYFKGKKTRKVVKSNKPIIVYCGYVGCARSHVGAAYLVKKGYKNVFRFAGGISAWLDSPNYPIEGTDAKPAA